AQPPTPAPTRTAMLAPPREDVEAKLKDLIASFQCASVNTRLSEQSGLTLTGFVSRPEDLDRLHRELSGLQGVKLARDAVAVYAWPHCAIVKLLLQDANAAKTSAAPRLQFGKPDLVYHNGDKLTFKVGEERRHDAYLYVDYIDNSGQ